MLTFKSYRTSIEEAKNNDDPWDNKPPAFHIKADELATHLETVHKWDGDDAAKAAVANVGKKYNEHLKYLHHYNMGQSGPHQHPVTKHIENELNSRKVALHEKRALLQPKPNFKKTGFSSHQIAGSAFRKGIRQVVTTPVKALGGAIAGHLIGGAVAGPVGATVGSIAGGVGSGARGATKALKSITTGIKADDRKKGSYVRAKGGERVKDKYGREIKRVGTYKESVD